MEAEALRLARALRAADAVIVFSGAGASAAAGIPTFRGEGKALWMRAGGALLPIFGTPFGWRWAPWLAWSAYRRWFAPAILGAAPTAFHRTLALLDRPDRPLGVITQNVDGLEVAAGVDASHVAQLHGTARRLVCGGCAGIMWSEGDRLAHADVPACGACGGYPRPDATLYTEALPEDALARATRFVNYATPDSVVLIVGLGGTVPSSDPFIRAASRFVPAARRFQVNPTATAYDAACGTNLRVPADSVFAIVERTLGGSSGLASK